MTRPKKLCRIKFFGKACLFKPNISRCKNFPSIELSPEETEALRLKNITGLDQTKSAKEMGISQSTFQRILSSAYRKISEALVYGRMIKITSMQKENEKQL
jgi:predicted DNA-binding protein (UPF0251 family)